MQAISVKDLRSLLPSIRERLAHGEEFLLMFQSRPIAKLTPAHEPDVLGDEASDQELELASIDDMDDDRLSKKELDYYLAL